MPKTGRWVPNFSDDIPGCGKSTPHHQGTHTYSDFFITTRSVVPGVKKTTEKQLNTGSRAITNHSWKNLTAHVIRTSGKVTRVVIKNILLGPHGTVINAVWSEGGRTRKRSLSPLVLTWVHHLWTHADIVSEESDEESVQSTVTALPLLQFDCDSWAPVEKAAGIGLLNETNRFLQYTQSLKYQHRVMPPSPAGVEVPHHSWVDHVAYLIRKSKVTRVRIGSIVLLPHRVQMRVYWKQNQRQRRALVSPVALMLVLALWFKNDIISDDSDCPENEPPLRLPLLSVSLAKLGLPKSQVNALAFVVNELNQLSQVDE